MSAKKATAVLEADAPPAAPKRRVQVRAVMIVNPDTKKPQRTQRVSLGRTVTVDFPLPAESHGPELKLQAEVIFREDLHATRRQYPKTVEVDW